MEAFLHPAEPVFCFIHFCTDESGLNCKLALRPQASDLPRLLSLTQGAKGQDGAQGPPGTAGNPVSPVLPDFWGLPRRGGPDEHLFPGSQF